jgi:hypothetical protein
MKANDAKRLSQFLEIKPCYHYSYPLCDLHDKVLINETFEIGEIDATKNLAESPH